MKNKQKQPRILFYDIETSLLLGYLFSLGKQVMRHNQLLGGYFSRTHVICITYKWSHERKAKILTWGDSENDERNMVEEFYNIARKADIIIGKNSDRFDNKHMNTQRLWMELAGDPMLFSKADDLEKQMRKHFFLPSYSLDYLSDQLGLGGKKKMDFSDWRDLAEYRMLQLAGKSSAKLLEILTGNSIDTIKKAGLAASKKMFSYGLKDTRDTEKMWKHCARHFTPKFNYATFNNSSLVCRNCGSSNIRKNGTRFTSQSKKQFFYCRDHHGYAGCATILKNGELGKMS